MPLSKKDVESAFLGARAEVLAWQKEFLTQWQGHEGELLMIAIARKLMNLPPEAQAKLKANNPEAWAQVMEIGGKADGNV